MPLNGFHQQIDVDGEKADRDRQKDDAEKFPDDIDSSFAEEPLDTGRHTDNEINPNHIQDQGDHDIDAGILRTQGQQRRKRPRARQQREDERNESRLFDRSLILENLDIEDHLQRKQENDERTGYGKRFDVHVEKPQETVACIKETDHQEKRDDRRFHRIHILPVFLQIDDDRNGTDNVDHREEYDERAEHLLRIKFVEHKIFLFYCPKDTKSFPSAGRREQQSSRHATFSSPGKSPVTFFSLNLHSNYHNEHTTMNIISKLFKKKEEETEAVSKGSVEEFVTLIRVYYQAVIAVQLSITNLNILNDMALFKRMLKIPTQNNKLGVAERSRARKILMQEYGLNENFFKEIDASIKKNCRTQNDIKSYFIMYQGFNNDLFSLLDNLMQWKFRFSMLVKKLLYAQTQKTIHEIVTRSEWKDVNVQKVAWRIRKYKETLGYSEQWMTDFVYNVVLMAKEDAKKKRKEDK